MPSDITLSVVLPCLNEETSVGLCVQKALAALAALNVAGEVVVADNGSGDRSRAIAAALGARVVDAAAKGYGNAVMRGVRAAAGDYVIMADADNSYDLSCLADFYAPLLQGADLVVGNRYTGGISTGAMPLLHRYLGTPALTCLTNLCFGTSLGDSQCGMRGFRRSAFEAWGLSAGGMEFASEMIARAAMRGSRVTEVPAAYKKADRPRPPHLRTFRDGLRHFSLLLKLYAGSDRTAL